MFIDKNRFSFVKILEENWQLIKKECGQLLSDDYDPWIQGSMYKTGWNIYPLVALNNKVPKHAVCCPQTVALIDAIPGVTLAGFSRMEAGTIIKPHVGWAKSVYRMHLGLFVPDQCGLKVGEETRAWEEGKCLIFDDTVKHEAWNQSTQVRINLLLDFLRPGLAGVSTDLLPAEVIEYANQLLENNLN